MRNLVNAWYMAIILVLVLAGSGLAQSQPKPELWNGTHWKEFSRELKVAYIKGIGNMADFEVAVSGRDKAGCISVGFVDELQGKTIASIVEEVDKFYKDNPNQMNMPVIEVVLRKCTALCKPEPPAAGKK